MLRRGAVALVALAAIAGSEARTADKPAASGLLLVANKGDQTLGIIDPAAGRSPRGHRSRPDGSGSD